VNPPWLRTKTTALYWLGSQVTWRHLANISAALWVATGRRM
jgi:hypothetical protein